MTNRATQRRQLSAVPAYPHNPQTSSHPLTSDARPILITFADSVDGGWWEPDERVAVIARHLPPLELAVTLLHEVGHMLCGDDAGLDDEAHNWLEEWAQQAASLLGLVRPGRWSVTP